MRVHANNLETLLDIEHLDLFAGTCGFSLALQMAGFRIKKHYFSEVDKHAIANTRYNFKDSIYVGSVTDVRGGGLRPNIVTFGSPCQDFSVAGKQSGLAGKRSGLLLEAIRIIREYRPGVFIWENVKGAFSSNDGADFWAILAAFANIGGYRLEWQLLNTSWFLPQNRERIYLVGHLDGRSKPGVFPIGENYKPGDPQKLQQAIISGTLSGANNSSRLSVDSGTTLVRQINPSRESGGKQPYQQNRVYADNGISPALRYDGRGFKVHSLHPRTGGKKQGGTGNLNREDGKTYCLDTLNSQAVELGGDIRRLTEIECERLQGFPDDWTRYGNYDGTVKEIPKRERYKLVGNAVSPPVIETFARKLKLSA